MLRKEMLKGLTSPDIADYATEFQEDLVLTGRRLERLRSRQKREPTWHAFDPMIQEVISIDIRIEEQEAVRDELTEQLALLAAELDRRQGLNQTIRMF